MQKIESIKIGLKEEIEKYKLKKTFFKDYSLSMKEISAWLKEKEKKMKIICSELYEKQLKEILSEIASHDFKTAKDFKTYLDTIIINAPTKSRKYKQSVFFDDENIKDIEYDKYTIPLLIDDENDSYIVLGIVKK